MTSELRQNLKAFYDKDVKRRDQKELFEWKREERAAFLKHLKTNELHSLLEIGAGTGRDGAFFAENGLDVHCIDLSEGMVQRCKERGLRASRMDMAAMTFADNSFNAVYALNCLLHVPDAELRQVLEEIKRVLQPGGLFFYGVYGGLRFEDVWPDDVLTPKRFFNYYPDEAIQLIVQNYFEAVKFKIVEVKRGSDFHFQSMIWRKAIA